MGWMRTAEFEAATRIVRTLREAGHGAVFAGGCVRDMLRGEEPHDFDVATDATPERVQELFARTVAVGAHFGVVVVMDGRIQIEVATFRTDGAYLDGRHPSTVRFTTAEEDAARRDFTINGMFFDPLEHRVLDFVGGREDLEKGVIRAIGDAAQRFREDRLRLMRALRFAARFGFSIEAKTWDAICAQAAAIREVSAERVRDELVKILLHPSRLAGFDLLDASGLLREVLPEVEALKGCEQPPQFHPEGDVFQHTRIMLGLLGERVSVPLVFSVLLHDIGKPPTSRVDETGRIRFNGHDAIGAKMAEAVMERLRFSRAECDATVEAVAQHMVFKDVTRMRPAKVRRFIARPGFADELELHRVDCQSSHGDLENHAFLLAKIKEYASEPIIPPPLVTGKDLIAMGMKPGPRFGQILEAVETRQLEGAFVSREDALEWVRAEFPP